MFVGFWDGDYVNQLPYVCYYVVVKSRFKHAREECDLSCGECNVISLYVLCFSVNGSVCFVRCVSVNCLVKQFAICLVKKFEICLGVVVILLLNIMELFSVVGGALLDRSCMVFQRVCLLWS